MNVVQDEPINPFPNGFYVSDNHAKGIRKWLDRFVDDFNNRNWTALDDDNTDVIDFLNSSIADLVDIHSDLHEPNIKFAINIVIEYVIELKDKIEANPNLALQKIVEPKFSQILSDYSSHVPPNDYLQGEGFHKHKKIYPTSIAKVYLSIHKRFL